MTLNILEIVAEGSDRNLLEGLIFGISGQGHIWCYEHHFLGKLQHSLKCAGSVFLSYLFPWQR